MSNQEDEVDVGKAKRILRGLAASPEEIDDLSERLKKKDQFGWARRLLERGRENDITAPELRLRLGQRHALCTYKDPDLPAVEKLDQALEILRSVDDLRSSTDQETLGLAGAIHKRMFELYARKRHLERSYSYYRRGYDAGPRKDYGYTGINAAYVLDVLANLEEEEAREAGTTSTAAAGRREEARAIRQNLVEALPELAAEPDGDWLNKTWWYLVTLAEAHFGLAQYEEAQVWLDKAKARPNVPQWEFETTARQLASIAHLQGEQDEQGPAWRALERFLGNVAAVQTVFLGRVGLALSGGGFRASLFHLGVLAKLAELDRLRHVHVLSCVSGGSIVGAHYYLEVRKLLQDKDDHEIGRDDYIEIVDRLIREFMRGVQRNVRTRVAGSPWVNLQMLFSSTYSRTLRIGELFEKHIYSRVDDGEGDRPRWMNEIFIKPKNEPNDFNPKVGNWRRSHKVPMLVLNATTLNTGHNWQFTASWMGEPPGAIDTEIDGNQRLRRMYYNEAPEEYRNVRLGLAVGASACVPGIFEPIALPGLYPGMTVRLVDGGVHDNQGISSLLEQDCSVVLVSDASGQMTTEPQPKGGIVWPLLRSNNTIMARVRQAQFRYLKARQRSSLVTGLMVVHLKMGLDVDSLDWVDCAEPPSEPTVARRPLTEYGLLKSMQERLAAIRTDLDSFSQIEAYALMTSGYLQTQKYIQGVLSLPHAAPTSVTWPFLAIEEPMTRRSGVEKQHDHVKKCLDVGSQRAFKVWRQVLPLRIVAWMLGGAAAAGLAWAWWRWPTRTLYHLDVGDVGWMALMLVVGYVLGQMAVKLLEYRQTASRAAIALGMGLVGWIPARIHVHLFDRLFLRVGRLR